MAPEIKVFMSTLELTFPALLDPQGDVVRMDRLRGLPIDDASRRLVTGQPVEVGRAKARVRPWT